MPVLGVAFDGSPWVTAASSVALVGGTMGIVAASGILLARKVSRGELELPSGPDMMQQQEGVRRRVQPLQKSSAAGEQEGVQVPPKAQSVDTFSEGGD